MFSCPRRLALLALALAAVIWSAEALPHSIGGVAAAEAAEAQLKSAQRPALTMTRYHNLFHRRSVRTKKNMKWEFNFLSAASASCQ